MDDLGRVDSNNYLIDVEDPKIPIHSKALGPFEYLRALKLQILGYSFSWKSPIEHRKVVIHKSHRMAIYHVLLHLVPLAAAIVVITLNWTKYFIGPTFSYSTTLQFVAKLHEILMQASISEVLLYVIRAQVVEDYIPLGALLAASQNPSISYLWSLEYWSILHSRVFSGRAKATFVILIPLFIVMMVTVGPSSAVLMIPNPNLLRTINSITSNGISYEEIAPPQVGAPYDFTVSLEGFDLKRDFGSYWNLMGSVSQTFNDRQDSNLQRLFRYTTTRRKELNNDSNDQESYISTIATIPTDASVVSLVSQLPSHSQLINATISAQLPHPIVVARCTPQEWLWANFTKDSSLQYIQDHGTMKGLLPTFHDLIKMYPVPSQMDTVRLDSLPPLWMSSPETGSSSLIGVLPKLHNGCMADYKDAKPCTLSEMLSQGCHGPWRKCFMVPVCTISAFWSFSDNILKFDSENLFDTKASYIEGAAIASVPLLLDAGFDRPKYDLPIALNISRVPYFNSPDFTNLFLGGPMIVPPEPKIAFIFAKMLARYEQYRLSSGPDAYSTPYLFEIKQQGFGFEASSTAAQLSLTVMTAYCLLVFAYLTYILITGLTSTAWNSALELVVLALQSKTPYHLGYWSVGIDTLKTYQQPVGIRVNSNDEAELIFAHDNDVCSRGLRKVVPNKAY